MSNKKQNLYVLLEQNQNTSITSVKAGNMFLNRFCIDEDAPFELDEIHYLKKYNYGEGRYIWSHPRQIDEKGTNTPLYFPDNYNVLFFYKSN